MFSTTEIPWDKTLELWTQTSLRNQWLCLIAVGIISILFSKLLIWSLRKKLNKISGIPWRDKVSSHVYRLIPPISFLLFSLLGLSLFRSLNLNSANFLQPGVNVGLAWLVYRLISIFIRNQVWLRTTATILLGLAVLQSFGVLSASLEILDLVAFNLGERRISILNLINGVGVLLFLLWGSTMIGSATEKKIRQLPHLPPSLQVLLTKVLRTLLIAISFAIALSTIGLDLSSFAILGGAIGVGIGFGLQKVVSNLVSGLILLVDRSIKPGDVIEIDGTYGWINSLRARYASVITRDGKEHLIPNEDLITNRVINWSFSDRNVRVRLPIGISYEANPRQAIQLCLESAKACSRTLQEPEPKCLVRGFGENSIDLELRFWIDDPSNGVGNIRSEVLLGIWDRFKDNKINIPFPQRDIRIIDNERPKQIFENK